MLVYPDLDPVALRIGPIAVHWYGIMYLVGFAAGWWLGRLRARRPASGWKPAQIDDLLFYVAIGIIVGGRVGYILFYGFPDYLNNPLGALKIWQGGMSFHGGLLGVLVAMGIYARRHGRTFFQVTDYIAPLVPPGLFAGRIGNFINGELWGRVTDVPWAVVYPPRGPAAEPRHPTQLYEAALEGLVLFAILWVYSRQPRPTMAVSGMFLLWYGMFRFLVEFVRVPDAQLGYLALGWVTMGQLLSVPMILLGSGFIWWAYRRPASQDP